MAIHIYIHGNKAKTKDSVFNEQYFRKLLSKYSKPDLVQLMNDLSYDMSHDNGDESANKKKYQIVRELVRDFR